jgi:hypothetical protein
MVAPSAAIPAISGSMSGKTSACRNATVAPATQMIARPIVAAAAEMGPKASAATAARAANGSWTSDLPEKGRAMPPRSRGHYRLAFTMMADSAFRN